MEWIQPVPPLPGNDFLRLNGEIFGVCGDHLEMLQFCSSDDISFDPPDAALAVVGVNSDRDTSRVKTL